MTALSNINTAGRAFDYIFDPKRQILGIVDYAPRLMHWKKCWKQFAN
ncbi:MAG: hypothetical protein IPJ74_24855 [Saprospiraceae bacterium]|nr:hypothetical protein [Saprospiraceae bacterium]